MTSSKTTPDSKPKVSVIMPIYNTAAYLREALDSICQQTLKELEIILLNDGSTDESMEIIREYAQADSRIQWHEQPNQGLSVARNQAMKHATGKYIYMMDSDDRLDTDALRQCYERCEESALDFVCFDAEPMQAIPANSNIPDYCRKDGLDTSVRKGIELLDYELQHDLFRPPVWLCFVNLAFLRNVFHRFHPGIIHEDHPFTIAIHLQAERASYIPQAFFKRRIRATSIMGSQFGMRNIEGYTAVFKEIEALGEKNPAWKAVIEKYFFQTINAVVWASHRMTFLEKVETACRFKRMGFGKYATWRNWAVFWIKRK